MTPTEPNYSAPTRVVSPSRPTYVDLRMQDPFRPATRYSRALGKSLLSSLRFLMETEVHVYSFAVSVNILISFYPFIVAMVLICLHLFQWPAAANVIIQTVKDYFPGDFGMDIAGYLKVSSRRGFSWLSIFLLFFTANGIFTPLEVAFNRIWGAKKFYYFRNFGTNFFGVYDARIHTNFRKQVHALFHLLQGSELPCFLELCGYI